MMTIGVLGALGIPEKLLSLAWEARALQLLLRGMPTLSFVATSLAVWIDSFVDIVAFEQ
jgi:hypothetical protein